MTHKTNYTKKLAAWLHDPAEKQLVLFRDPVGHEGGSVVEVGKAQSFAAEWEAAYVSAFPDRASLARFFVMATPAPGACSVV